MMVPQYNKLINATRCARYRYNLQTIISVILAQSLNLQFHSIYNFKENNLWKTTVSGRGHTIQYGEPNTGNIRG